MKVKEDTNLPQNHNSSSKHKDLFSGCEAVDRDYYGLAREKGVRMSRVDWGGGGVHILLPSGEPIDMPKRGYKVSNYEIAGEKSRENGKKDGEHGPALQASNYQQCKTKNLSTDNGNHDPNPNNPPATPVVDLTATTLFPAATENGLASWREDEGESLRAEDITLCTIDEDGGLRAPDLETPSEEQAELLYLMYSFLRKRAAEKKARPRNSEGRLEG